MERIRNLNRYQKSVLLLLLAMAVAFTAAYAAVTSRVGYAYRKAILLPQEESGAVVYSGRIRGENAVFTVTADKTVTFTYGEKVYGPYTAHEDPTAIPEDRADMAEHMTGVELRDGDEILFRGGVWAGVNAWSDGKEELMLFGEDGGFSGLEITYSTGDGNVYDSEGNVVDEMKPSALEILELMRGPALTHEGVWLGWLGGVFISLVTALSILFADELFRWNLAFQIRNVRDAEPSEWEIMTRYIAWTLMPFLALFCYILGLTELAA